MSIKHHGYTVSPAAKQGLYDLFQAAVAPSRTTLWARKPLGTIDAAGRPVYTDNYRSAHVEGLSHALIQLARASDFDDWMPNPTIPMYLTTPGTKPLFYNPPDLEYLKDAEQDSAAWSELDSTERKLRLEEYNRKRGWDPDRLYRLNKTLDKLEPPGYKNLSLSLPNDIRRYYHNLRLFHKIPLLPGCRHPHNLTTSVGAVLEALGTGHLFPSAAYLHLISEPNPRKASAIKARLHMNGYYQGQRTFGNHAHTPYQPREWRALPTLNNFTQADVDYCCREDNQAHLGDLAIEACALNPTLQLPSTTAVSGDNPTASSEPQAPARSKPHIDLVPPTTAWTEPDQGTYYYKGKDDLVRRDVTRYILEAYTSHYEQGLTYPQLQELANRAGLPLYMLQRLTTREYVRRLHA